eukprot:3996807-Prymnesium_polylepis.1
MALLPPSSSETFLMCCAAPATPGFDTPNTTPISIRSDVARRRSGGRVGHVWLLLDQRADLLLDVAAAHPRGDRARVPRAAGRGGRRDPAVRAAQARMGRCVRGPWTSRLACAARQ